MAINFYRLETYLKGLPSYSHLTFNQVILLDNVTIWEISIVEEVELHFQKSCGH